MLQAEAIWAAAVLCKGLVGGVIGGLIGYGKTKISHPLEVYLLGFENFGQNPADKGQAAKQRVSSQLSRLWTKHTHNRKLGVSDRSVLTLSENGYLGTAAFFLPYFNALQGAAVKGGNGVSRGGRYHLAHRRSVH